MHSHDRATEELTEAIVRCSVERMRLDPPPLDHPRFLSFVPAAPTEAAILFDLVVGASSIYAGSWLEGVGAIHAENEALRWIADLAGLPPTAGGVFVTGGTAGNLSALIAARWKWRHQADGAHDRTRGLMVASAGAHSSIVQAAQVMDADVVAVPADDRGRMCGGALRATVDALDAGDRDRLFAVVATSGTTNAGVIDDLAGAADVAADLDLWFHVDGPYGGAALAAPTVRQRFEGIERADSFIVDPHKWLFAPFDSCALLYRDPAIARAAHTQHGEYLDVLHSDGTVDEPWNAGDYAHHEMTRTAASLIDHCTVTELLMEPELSILLFRRVGWTPAQYQAWSDAERAAGRSFVVPTTWQGEVVLRFCIVNPSTTEDDIRSILATLDDVDEDGA